MSLEESVKVLTTGVENLTRSMEIFNNQLRQTMTAMQHFAPVVNDLEGIPSDVKPSLFDDTDTEDTEETPDNCAIDSLPDGSIDWNDVDAMNCPWHSGMMSGTRSKNKTGATKGCFAKIKSAAYTPDMYAADRRVLIAAAADNEIDDVIAPVTETTTAAPTSNVTQITPQAAATIPQAAQMSPQPQDINEPGIGFMEVCARHVAVHGDETLRHRLMKVGRGEPGYDHSELLNEPTSEVTDWIISELLEHHANA